MTFLEAVNRVLRSEGIIMGDDDDQTSFSQTQHAASMSLAKIAIQSELADLVSGGTIPYELADSTVTTVNGTRTYTLASGFQSLQETFIEETDGTNVISRIYHFRGGESHLRKLYPSYRETTGSPIYFYFTGGASKTIGLHPVPNDARIYRYYYESDVSLTLEADSLPFTTSLESETFVRMAARQFKFLKASVAVREKLFPEGVARDSIRLEAHATLVGLLNPLPVITKYGKRYGRA